MPRFELRASLQQLLKVVAIVSFVIASPTQRARAQQVPTTAAGRQFTTWLNAINNADRAALQAFIDAGKATFTADQAMGTANRTGGFDIRKVQSSTDTSLVVLVQERGPSKQFVDVTVAVQRSTPERIATLAMRIVEPPAEFAAPKLTAAELELARKSIPYRQFAAYLDVFASGDRDKMRRFFETTYPDANLDGEVSFAQATGGFDMREVLSFSATTVSGLVQERNSDQFARFTVVVDSAEPHKISRMLMRAVPRPAEFAIARLSEPALASALRDKLTKDAAADRFAGAVIVAKVDGGRANVLYSGAYGQADRERGVANTLDTKFRIGSMNKMFTATSILQLVQTGKIKLNEPFGTYIKDYPNKEMAGKVTIHHLLTHTGGTGDFFGPEFAAHRLELKTAEDYVALFGKRPVRFEPGSRWEYSNYGMLLLGMVIERVSGLSYYDYVEQHIYRPAGMTGSGSLPESETVAGRSSGYMRRNGAWVLNTNTLPYRGTSAGGGYSTVRDLLAFAEALMNHKLLNAENTALLIAGKVDVGNGAKYAYGFEDARSNGEGAVGHSGGAPGMNGDLRIHPQSGYIIAVLSNLDPPAAQQVTSFITPRLPR